MSIETLVTALTTAKFKVFYGKAPVGTQCPYVVLTEVTHPNFAADNNTLVETTSLELRLVEAEVHDWTLIASLETVLKSLSLPYSSEDLLEPSENVCETIYFLRFLGGVAYG